MKYTYCIFSDESGVFDNNNEEYFVFGGLILNTKTNDIKNLTRQYSGLEKNLKQKTKYKNLEELKAANLEPQDRRRFFTLLKHYQKFGIIIKLDEVHKQLFKNKKTKQRYQDFAYKIGLRRTFEQLIKDGKLSKEDEIRFNFKVDEHLTATDARYELREGLLQEFKEGSYNRTFKKFYPPLFPNTQSLNLLFEDSEKTILIRAADIIANRLYFEVKHGNWKALRKENMIITKLP